MGLPLEPPIAPMLARLTRELPADADRYTYEPKWDGFRCLCFRDGEHVDLRSRHDRPLARYFPEVVAGLRGVGSPGQRFVLDGELILAGPAGFDFAALMNRLHPAASRVERLSREAPASYIAFDLLAESDDDLTGVAFVERRRRLERLLAGPAPPVFLTPATRDTATARRWYEQFAGAGIDGVVAKADELRYEPGRRTMLKIKRERTADCVVAGFRLLGDERLLSSLILGLYDDEDELRHVGVVTQFPAADRVRFLDELAPLVTPLAEHPWRQGFLIERSPLGRLKGSAARWTPEMDHDWIPLRPELVVEVGFDQVDVDRFRHPARFRRWRPDREARSCRIDQIEVSAPELGTVLAAS
jgi:ATP-dependent DNA ligase